MISSDCVRAFYICIILGTETGSFGGVAVGGEKYEGISKAYVDMPPNALAPTVTCIFLAAPVPSQERGSQANLIINFAFLLNAYLSWPFEENQGCNAENVPVNT